MERFDHYFLSIFLLILSSVFLFTLSDYGIPWDSALGELYIGDKNYYFIKTLDKKHLDYARDTIPLYHEPSHPDFFRTSKYVQVRPMHVWPLGPTLSALTKDVFYTKLRWLDPIDAHHISLLFLGVSLVAIQYYFARRNIGLYGAVVSVLALVLFPRFWAHLHNNIKDIPATVFFSFVIFSFFFGIQKRNLSLLLLSAVLWGLALSAKANAFFLLFILGPWLLYVIIERYLSDQKLLTKSECVGLFLFPGIGIITFLVVWPYMLLDFPSHLREHLEYLASRGLSGSSAWNVRPIQLVVYTIPIVTLGFGTFGLLSIFCRGQLFKESRSVLVLILLWCLIPVLRVSLPGTVDFDGMRHWLEFLPAFSLLAGSGAQFLFQELFHMVRKPYRIGVSILVFAFPLYGNILYHPYQLTYFNPIIGGLAGARTANCCEAIDYWGSSYRKGISWLNAHAEPNSILYVGVAEWIVDAVRSIWLREDIHFQPMQNFPSADEDQNKVRYLIYITRTGWYSPLVRTYDKNVNPIYSINVDGVPILKILKISRVIHQNQGSESG